MIGQKDLDALAKPIKFIKCFSKKKLMACIKKDLKEKVPGVDTNNYMSMMMAFQQLIFNDVDPDSFKSRSLPDILPPMEGIF